MVAAAATLFALSNVAVASAADPVLHGGAYGLKADVVTPVAHLSAGPMPSVTLPSNGGQRSASLVDVNLLGLGSVGALKATTAGSTTAGTVDSSASAADVSLLGLVSVGVVKSQCNATADAANGNVSVVDLVVAGIPIAVVNPGPNTRVALPIGSVTLNEQTRSQSGMTVNAVHVRLNALVASGDIVIAQSRCGVQSAQ